MGSSFRGYYAMDEVRPDHWKWVDNPASRESPCTRGLAYLSQVRGAQLVTLYLVQVASNFVGPFYLA